VAAEAGEASTGEPAPARPNILRITCEDMSPSLGCFGDLFASTPDLDRLAAGGVRYTAAFAPIGVCAPSRSTLITGMHAPSLGTHPMRCQGILPAYVRPFPEYLRQAGYYCSNNSKDGTGRTTSSGWPATPSPRPLPKKDPQVIGTVQ
jgi:uncharacterized sulfatase